MNKKEIILHSALTLFATNGFNGVSTLKIAKNAGVSEGLIFKHYKNKQGLLNSIIERLDKKIYEIARPVLKETDPKLIIKKSIINLIDIDKKDYDFWKLQYKLKMDTNYDTQNKFKPYMNQITTAFRELNYKNPEQEALLFFEILDAIFRQIVTKKLKNPKAFLGFLAKKYQVD